MHGVRTRGALGARARAWVGGATHGLRVGDEANAADRERAAAMPAGSGARQRQAPKQKETARGGYYDDWASVKKHAGRARVEVRAIL